MPQEKKISLLYRQGYFFITKAEPIGYVSHKYSIAKALLNNNQNLAED